MSEKISTDVLEAVFRKSGSVVTRNVAGEIILVPIVRGPDREAALYTLDAVAAFLWERLDGRHCGKELCQELQQAYEVPAEQAVVDLRRFLEELAGIGAIERVDD